MRSVEHMAEVVVARQESGEGRFAVYPDLADVLDVESARAVVDELLRR